MGHINAGIYQAYMNERIQYSVQAGFLGKPSEDALIKALSHMSRDMDTRAPKRLTGVEKESLKTHPWIVDLRELRDTLSKEIQRIYGTLKKAQAAGDQIYQQYLDASHDLENAKQKLKRHKEKQTRAAFFDKIETEDAIRQLASLDMKEEELEPIPALIEHVLEERKLVAELLFEKCHDKTPQQKQEHLEQTIEALVSLCRLQEPPRRAKATHDRDWGILPTPEPSVESTPEPPFIQAPTKITNRQCLFCISKGLDSSFTRPRKATEHLDNQQLVWFNEDAVIPCPDEYCRSSGVLLFGHINLKNHIRNSHVSVR
jgi:hypothetical protein